MRVRLSFDPTDEKQAKEIHHSRLLITAIGAWVRETFLVDEDFSVLPFSTESLIEARAGGRKGDQMIDFKDPIIFVRLQWFFNFFRKKQHVLAVKAYSRRYNLLFGHNVYCYTLLLHYYRDFKKRIATLKSIRLHRSDVYRNIMEGSPYINSLARSFGRFKWFTRRKKPKYKREYKLLCLHTFLSKLYDQMARANDLCRLDIHAQNCQKRRALVHLLSTVRCRKVNTALVKRDKKLYDQNLCRHYLYLFVDTVGINMQRRKSENKKIMKYNSNTLLKLKKTYAVKAMKKRSDHLFSAREHLDDAVRYNNFHLRSIGMDAMYKQAVRNALFKGAFRAGSKMYRHVALRKAFNKLSETSKFCRRYYVSIMRGCIHLERKNAIHFFERIRWMVGMTNIDSTRLYKSVLLWKSRRLRQAIEMFKLNMDIRIKRREMLRSAHIDYHKNMQNLLCTQWLKVYSEQMESKSRNRRNGPFGKIDLASLARKWLDRRCITVTRRQKYSSSDIGVSDENIIDTRSTSSRVPGTRAPLRISTRSAIPELLPETEMSVLAKAKPRNNLERIFEDVAIALRPKYVHVNLNLKDKARELKS